IDADVEQQIGVTPDRAVIDAHQLFYRFQLVVLAGVIKPARPDRDVAFGWKPDSSIFVAHVQSLFVGETRERPFIVARRPVGLAGKSPLVANPAYVGSRVAEDQRVWLQAFDRLEKAVKVVNHAFLAVVRAVEPRFEEIAVPGAHLAPLILED